MARQRRGWGIAETIGSACETAESLFPLARLNISRLWLQSSKILPRKPPLPDLVPRTVTLTAEQDGQLVREAGWHDRSCSEVVRQALRMAYPLLRECPELFCADDARIAEVMRKVGKILVILEEN